MIYCLCCPVWGKGKKDSLNDKRIEKSVKMKPTEKRERAPLLLASNMQPNTVDIYVNEKQPEPMVIDGPKMDEATEVDGGALAPAMTAMAAVAVTLGAHHEESDSESESESSSQSLTSDESSSDTDITYGTYDSSDASCHTHDTI